MIRYIDELIILSWHSVHHSYNIAIVQGRDEGLVRAIHQNKGGNSLVSIHALKLHTRPDVFQDFQGSFTYGIILYNCHQLAMRGEAVQAYIQVWEVIINHYGTSSNNFNMEFSAFSIVRVILFDYSMRG